MKKKAAGGASPLLTRMDSVWGAITSAGSQLGHKLKRGWFSKAIEERQVLYLGASGAERPRCDTYHVGAEQQKPNAIYSVLSGNWLSHLDFDEQRYWTLQESLNQDGHWSRRPEEGGPEEGDPGRTVRQPIPGRPTVVGLRGRDGESDQEGGDGEITAA